MTVSVVMTTPDTTAALAGRSCQLLSGQRRPEGASLGPSTLTFRYEDLVQGVIGTGSIDDDAVFQILREVGFTGWISIEDGDDPVDGFEHLQASARFLRAMMARYGVG